MSHERLEQVMQAHQEALERDEEHSPTHVSIFSILQALDRGEITEGQAQRLLRYQALRVADAPTHAALYRQAAAAIRQMQREEH